MIMPYEKSVRISPELLGDLGSRTIQAIQARLNASANRTMDAMAMAVFRDGLGFPPVPPAVPVRFARLRSVCGTWLRRVAWLVDPDGEDEDS